jgi:uncharacterized membrane protein
VIFFADGHFLCENAPIMKRLLLLILILLAFGLRVYQLDAFSFWQDEGLTPLRANYSIAQIISNEVIIQDGVSQDTHPPLYFLLIHITRRLLGESDFAYRSIAFFQSSLGSSCCPSTFNLAGR